MATGVPASAAWLKSGAVPLCSSSHYCACTLTHPLAFSFGCCSRELAPPSLGGRVRVRCVCYLPPLLEVAAEKWNPALCDIVAPSVSRSWGNDS